jgi:hypothetical protein
MQKRRLKDGHAAFGPSAIYKTAHCYLRFGELGGIPVHEVHSVAYHVCAGGVCDESSRLHDMVIAAEMPKGTDLIHDGALRAILQGDGRSEEGEIVSTKLAT